MIAHLLPAPVDSHYRFKDSRPCYRRDFGCYITVTENTAVTRRDVYNSQISFGFTYLQLEIFRFKVVCGIENHRGWLWNAKSVDMSSQIQNENVRVAVFCGLPK